jgi:hypothetical protein
MRCQPFRFFLPQFNDLTPYLSEIMLKYHVIETQDIRLASNVRSRSIENQIL